ncbi:MAG TPA: putative selenium-dependent hydroxylase accessory protein YqeC [Desulfobacteraceae bacterium]|nr:putative selenium-dependent hydroxylase accessory protein YqeC [Desulfobacteraceae bacterium]
MERLCEKMKLCGGGVISLVGAGGKTTIMFRLANEFAQHGESVMTTTTTKIFMPSKDQSSKIIISSSAVNVVEQSKKYLEKYRHLTASRGYLPSHDKLTGFDSEDIEDIWRSDVFKWIIVEADGAARKPLKAPAHHEPVIPVCSKWVIAVVGMDAVGKPLLDKWVFRPEIYSGITGLSLGETVKEESIARALTHENGIMKGCPSHAVRVVFLNKADAPDLRAYGRNIVNILSEMTVKTPDRVIIGSAGLEYSNLECYDL